MALAYDQYRSHTISAKDQKMVEFTKTPVSSVRAT